MATQILIDDVNWAELRDVSELRRVDRKAVNMAIVFEVDPESKMPVMRASMDDDIADATLTAVVTNWSLPFPLPSVDPASLDKLTLAQDDKLREAIQPHIDAIRGNDAPVKENAAPTPASAS